MNNFTVMTDAQLAAHDASTSKRYQAAAQEAQATIAKQATRIAALEADAARMDWIQKNLLCADWEYPQGEKNTQPVICISWTIRASAVTCEKCLKILKERGPIQPDKKESGE